VIAVKMINMELSVYLVNVIILAAWDHVIHPQESVIVGGVWRAGGVLLVVGRAG